VTEGERSLAGRVGVVTGASSGIGAAVACALAAAGMRVVIGARRADRLEEVAAGIRAARGEAHAVATDLCDEAQVERLIDAAASRYGVLDVLVNNAAVGHVRTVADGRTPEWRATLDTNIMGTLIACRAALRHMLPRGAGDIVNMTSASAHEAWPYLAAYAASKAAVHTLSCALRAEVAAQGVRVVTIEIHNVATEFGVNFDPAVLPLALARWTALGLVNPDAPLLEPKDVARAVVFQLTQPERASVHALTIRSRTN
jgi:NADP-dependent 3-hydroxy acid dehydrogenase YdfG